MSDQSYGLRFDIYERVHLSSEEISIQELEEVELFPRIQVIPGDEYATLRGHLLLTGLYRGEDETRELSHLIPVEITVPLSRVNRLEDISVEIENFDVDLLNERSLNVTGVLSLQGIETASFAPAAQEWNSREYSVSYEQGNEEEQTAPWVTAEVAIEPQEVGDVIRDEPILIQTEEGWQPHFEHGFNHDVTTLSGSNDASFYDPQAFDTQERFGQDAFVGAEEQTYEQPHNNDFAAFSDAQAQVEEIPVWNFEAFEADSERVQADWQAADGADPTVSSVQDQEVFAQQHVSSVFSEQTAEVIYTEVPALAESFIPEEAEVQRIEEEKPQELKVALGSQNKIAPKSEEQLVFSQLLSASKPAAIHDVVRSEEEPSKGVLQPEPEERHWKQAFISNLTESPFRRVRMVIVQREETIEDIANRYSLSTRELLLHNRLSEQNIAEGQILYIP